jgi:hypothetical protein
MQTRRVWRVSRYGRVACGLVTLLFLAMTVSILTSLEISVRDGLILSAVFVFLGAGSLWVSQRCRLVLTDSSLVVVNPVRTQVIALQDIVDATPGAAGLVIETASVRHVRAFAVQTSHLAEWLRLPSRADDISYQVRLAAADAGAALRPGPRHLAPPDAGRLGGGA